MDSTGFVGLAHVLAGRYTVVTYDPRADQAILKFMAHAGLGEAPGQEPGAPSWQPIPEQVATMRADAEVFLAFLFRPTTNYRPDIDTLRAAAPCIVVAVGETSKGQLAHRTVQAPPTASAPRLSSSQATTSASSPNRGRSPRRYTRYSAPSRRR